MTNKEKLMKALEEGDTGTILAMADIISCKNMRICDTDRCPYRERCHENPLSECFLSDNEELAIWLEVSED